MCSPFLTKFSVAQNCPIYCAVTKDQYFGLGHGHRLWKFCPVISKIIPVLIVCFGVASCSVDVEETQSELRPCHRSEVRHWLLKSCLLSSTDCLLGKEVTLEHFLAPLSPAGSIITYDRVVALINSCQTLLHNHV